MISNKCIAIFYIVAIACGKDLDKPFDTTSSRLETIQDAQSLMDNAAIMNNSRPMLGELAADNYFVPDDIWASLTPLCKYSYIWDADPFRDEEVLDWNKPYAVVLQCNLVLEAMSKMENEENTDDYNNLKGQAFFYRGLSFMDLAQLFCKPYEASTARTDMGIPLKLNSDAKDKTPRATVQQTYDQIIRDLVQAEHLLPLKTAYKTRPSKAAANALLSRVYLSMGHFDSASLYTIRSLSIYDSLLDYNVIPNTSLPFKGFKSEVIWEGILAGSRTFNLSTNCPVDSVLYDSYQANDLRKDLFFTNNGNMQTFKGTYEGTRNASKFAGLATGELYLTLAECYARNGEINNAMNELNKLMQKRWKNDGSYVPFTAAHKEEALTYILNERRKELVYRGIRWMDLRRLNVMGAGISIRRYVDNVMYTLEPKSNKYVFPIPKQELLLNPIDDNPR